MTEDNRKTWTTPIVAITFIKSAQSEVILKQYADSTKGFTSIKPVS